MLDDYGLFITEVSYPIFTPILFIGVSLLCIYVFNKLKPWILNKYRRFQLLLTLVTTLSRINQGQTQGNQESPFVINDSDRSVSIPYSYNGVSYTAFMPFKRQAALAMNDLRVLVVLTDGRLVNITQQPGIPYLVTATELGGTEIRVINDDTGESVVYNATTIPNYCAEVM